MSWSPPWWWWYSTVKISCLGVILCDMIIIMLIIIMIIIIPSLGIILCEMIARVDADPDTLPRTQVSSYWTFINVVIVIIIFVISFIIIISLQNFGVEYKAFSALCPECPPDFLKLAFSCVRSLPLSASSFILSRFFNSSPILWSWRSSAVYLRRPAPVLAISYHSWRRCPLNRWEQ